MTRSTLNVKFIRIAEKTLIVAVPRSFPHVESDIYKATRCAWKASNLKACQEEATLGFVIYGRGWAGCLGSEETFRSSPRRGSGR